MCFMGTGVFISTPYRRMVTYTGFLLGREAVKPMVSVNFVGVDQTFGLLAHEQVCALLPHRAFLA
jgi:hypothetical protein